MEAQAFRKALRYLTGPLLFYVGKCKNFLGFGDNFYKGFCRISSPLEQQAPLSLQLSHLFWITGFITYIGSLMGSARVFVNDLSPGNIVKAINKYKVVFINLKISLYKIIMFQPSSIFTSPACLASLAHYDLKPDDLSSLKIIVTGGSQLNKSIVDEISVRFLFRYSRNPRHFYFLEKTNKFSQVCSILWLNGKLLCNCFTSPRNRYNVCRQSSRKRSNQGKIVYLDSRINRYLNLT